MPLKRFFIYIIIILLLSSNLLARVYQFNETPEIFIEGSSLLYDFVISKYKDSIEKEAGVKIIAKISDSGQGLISLVKGDADIAIISEDFDKLVKKINKESEYKFRPVNFHKFPVSNIAADFIINKNNPVNFLPVHELKKILIGQANNWADIGQHVGTINLGAIQLITPNQESGLFKFIEKYLLQGEKIADDRQSLADFENIAQTVSKLDGGIGFVSSKLSEQKRYNTKILETPASELRQEISLVLRKNNLDERYITFIKAVRKYAKYKPVVDDEVNMYDPYRS